MNRLNKAVKILEKQEEAKIYVNEIAQKKKKIMGLIPEAALNTKKNTEVFMFKHCSCSLANFVH